MRREPEGGLPGRLRWVGVLATIALVAGCGRVGFELLPLRVADAGPASDAAAGGGRMDGSVAEAGMDAAFPGSGSDGATDADIDDARADATIDASADAATEAGATSDSGTPPSVGFASGDFTASAPELQTNLSTSDVEWEPSFQPTGDISFSRQRPDSMWELYSASMLGAAFGPPAAYTEFGASGSPIHLTSAADGLHGLITWYDSTTASDIYVLSRASTADTWTRGALASISTAEQDWDPWLSRDGLRVYFSSLGYGGARSELLFAERASVSDPFGTPRPLSTLNSAGGEGNPSLTTDELAIVFSSDRADPGDIYYATRPSIDADFDAPVPMPAVNTGAYEWEPAISGDGCVLLFMRNDDLYMSRISPCGSGL